MKETKYINGDDTGINSGIDATDPGSSENDGGNETGNKSNELENNGSKSSEDGAKSEVSEPKPFVLDEDLALGKLKVNQTKEEVEEAMEATLIKSEEETTYGIKSEYLTYDDGTYIHLVEGKVYSITVASSSHPTPRGLKVGDSASEIEKYYGKPADITGEGVWIYSPRGYDLFFVTVKDNVVQSIKVSQVM
ncbi:MAG TPA: hypothetical protein GXX49_06655 [Clostridiaceae bacterium]|nr:hypothetical protein [Clostridiaceae bacterium]